MTNLTEAQKDARLLHHELLHTIMQLQYHDAVDRLVINDGIVFIYTNSDEVISLTCPELEPVANWDCIPQRCREADVVGASLFDELDDPDGPDFTIIPVLNTNQE